MKCSTSINRSHCRRGVDKNSIESRGPVDKRLAAETAVFGVFDGGKAVLIRSTH